MTSSSLRAPYDGELLGDVHTQSNEEIDAALETAHRLFRNRRAWLPTSQRLTILRRAAQIMSCRREPLALQIARESGKPLRDARIEVERAIDCVDIAVEVLRTDAGHVIPMGLNPTSAGRVAFTQYEPIGVVLAISAFNHPLNLVVHQVIPALAVGAPVVVKPSPKTPFSDVGPLITHAEVDRVAGWVDEAVETGAARITGGRKLSASCYANTVLLDPACDAKISRSEVFGPVIGVYSYSDMDEAIARANALPYSFQAAVFTRDLEVAMHCYRHLDGTAVMINESTLFRADWMPFAGARQSGHGVGGIPHTMRELQTEKLMVWRADALL